MQQPKKQMMRAVTIIISLVLVTQVCAEEVAANNTNACQESMDKFAHKLIVQLKEKFMELSASGAKDPMDKDQLKDKLIELAASRAKDSTDKVVDHLVDSLFQRTPKTSLLSQTDLESTTLGKPATLGKPTMHGKPMMLGKPTMLKMPGKNVIVQPALAHPFGKPTMLGNLGPKRSREVAHTLGKKVITQSMSGSARDLPSGSPSPPFVNEFGKVSGEVALKITDSFARSLVLRPPDTGQQERVATSVNRMKRDLAVLDIVAGKIPQLSTIELGLLLSSVAFSGAAPFFLGHKVIHTLVPALGAVGAAVGFQAEYTGKVAVSRGKEIAAATLQAAAEAELYLSRSERAKAIVPLCVAISATAAAYALVAPAIVSELEQNGIQTTALTEAYLVCPILAGLAAAVAALAATESASLANDAISVGARRFASSDDVGRTWMSATEQIALSTEKSKEKWVTFVLGVLPSPVLSVITPGDLGFKAVVAAAVAAAQAAYSLAKAEYKLAAAVEAVALKSRAASLADTYANQGARAGSILPFTSALTAFCAASTVAAVELLHFIPTVAAESALCVSFPAAGALVSAAASISKACAEIDAEAAKTAASTIAESREVDDKENNPITQTIALIRLTFQTVSRQWSKFINWIQGGRSDAATLSPAPA